MAPPDDVAQEGQPLRLSELFHENSKQRRNDLEFNRRIYMVNNNPDFHVLMARTFKHYPGAATIALPDVLPGAAAAGPVAVLGARRSVRRFDDRPLALAEVATLLHLCAGLTGSLEDGPVAQPVRAAPSAGALFPIETYLAASRIEGVEAGVYHYRVDRHVLERVSSRAPGPALAEATFDAKLFGQAAAVLIFAGAFGRSYFKYGERGYRFALLEAGHICQSALLAAAALGLGATPVGGFVDDEVNALLDLDGVDEAALYMAAVGHPRAGEAEPDSAEAAAARFLRTLAENTGG
ncbi:MAG TPA: SagB/ThcOx family dehydrogenase [Amaricoccus sp.]|uniref:SagB/ThcOx family dehydrogenase n=1 Tax=Amaricoccus sp. TaxID=1872485 RepID=UPI002B764FF8|nr:SagB/ThcOx family dehydrogenase [Amaricoccus sp.]HMQ92400.1 SagB/ThcOx family dehydrogenase [Amaricoccus sp.]HMR51422.1 SagB/ThcOx family dehydrogenase [Amaricoccus sp.]HMR60598.1 SagB/ThcOx family dehydrogenase [Amaricoccus sp.]HMT98311.1 SagB/ThcOx family dehydrogenase [Amaricoccus sp.]